MTNLSGIIHIVKFKSKNLSKKNWVEKIKLINSSPKISDYKFKSTNLSKKNLVKKI